MINGICMQNKFILQQSSSRIDIYIAAFGVLTAPLSLLQHPWMFPATAAALKPPPTLRCHTKGYKPYLVMLLSCVVIDISLFTKIPPSTTHHSAHSYY